ncbi:hypothetical protein M9H77_02634 [Catharanthus roseus]|uniref:Uncharacterized protein n=1 Tax=Catharanthus roseus TaxID=4058 RepID=A0ACC0C906_CATRO|nr:hypothetical protein M9H77_02634 [Catharanthus roseus]
MGRHSADLRFEGDRGLGEEPDRVRSLHIGGEEDERADDGGDGDDDDDDDNDDDDDAEDAGDEEQHVPLAPVAPASGSDGRPCHGKGKRSRNKRPDKAHDVSVPTQRKRVTASDYEQTGPEEGGPVDPELIPSYDRGLLKYRSRYMALTATSRACSSTPIRHYYRYLLSSGSRTRTASTCHGGEMTVTLHDMELILGVPAYGRAMDLHLSRDQLVAVI